MSRLSTLVALLLVALWLPATVHCRLEAIGLEELFSCAGHDCDENASHDSENDCADNFCQNVESGQFALTKNRLAVAQPLIAGHATVLSLVTFSTCLAAPPEILPQPERVTPWCPSWDFLRRTALPARAPDRIA